MKSKRILSLSLLICGVLEVCTGLIATTIGVVSSSPVLAFLGVLCIGIGIGFFKELAELKE
jgi:hypothetical protein